MKFGKVESVNGIDLSLPSDTKRTSRILSSSKNDQSLTLHVGCAKWGRQELKNFYPKGTGRRELEYYSSQFNCIEMNAFFYRIFPPEMVQNWYERSADDFTFFPKINQTISQYRRLKDCEDKTDAFLTSIAHFKEKLGPCFLQMHPTFSPESFNDLQNFIESWPKDVKLSIELRHPDWYADKSVNQEAVDLLEQNNCLHTITDTAGRRDMVHMDLTTPSCFIRYTGANDPTDYLRLDEWVERLTKWVKRGLKDIHFCVHQNVEKESPLLSAYFIEKMNKSLGLNHKIPETLR